MDAKFFVPFETAKQLREKGYPQAENDWYYEPAGEMLINEGVAELLRHRAGDNADGIVAAPTYHEVVDWLEGKGIYVTLDLVSLKYVETLQGTIEETFGWEGDVKRLHVDWRATDDYPTREAAINAAILKALEML